MTVATYWLQDTAFCWRKFAFFRCCPFRGRNGVVLAEENNIDSWRQLRKQWSVLSIPSFWWSLLLVLLGARSGWYSLFVVCTVPGFIETKNFLLIEVVLKWYAVLHRTWREVTSRASVYPSPQLATRSAVLAPVRRRRVLWPTFTAWLRIVKYLGPLLNLPRTVLKVCGWKPSHFSCKLLSSVDRSVNLWIRDSCW